MSTTTNHRDISPSPLAVEGGNKRRHRIMKHRFNRKIPSAADVWTSAAQIPDSLSHHVHGPVILKVGESEAGSVDRDCISYSDIANSQQFSTVTSATSGITLYYEDFESIRGLPSTQGKIQELEEEESSFKSVISVGNSECESETSPPSESNMNLNPQVLILSDACHTNDSSSSEISPVANQTHNDAITRVAIDESVDASDDKSESHSNLNEEATNATVLPASSTTNETSNERAQGGNTVPHPPIHAGHFAFPRFLLPPPMRGQIPLPHLQRLPPPPGHPPPPPPPFLMRPPMPGHPINPPWPPAHVLASASPSIEMTGWRSRPGFDQGEPENFSDRAQRTRTSDDSSRRTDHGNLLNPEELPRLHPGPVMPPPHPFLRVDEDSQSLEGSKDCCGRLRMNQSTFIRWFIGIISFIGLSCVVVGVVLGALTVSGSTRLTLCALMIGVGIVLITVSGIAWRLTALDPTARPTMLNLFGLRSPHSHRSIFPRPSSHTPYMRVRNSRDSHIPMPHGVPQEFLWQPPPPSYQASVRETAFHMLLQSQREAPPPAVPLGSPPPTYRADSRLSRPSIDDIIERPPSYRSERPQSSASRRPHSPVVMEGVGSELEETVHRVIANTSDRININDRQELLSNSQDPHHSACTQSNGHQTGRDENEDLVSVIDCSTAVPVGFRVMDEEEEREAQRRTAQNGPQNSRCRVHKRRQDGGRRAERRDEPSRPFFITSRHGGLHPSDRMPGFRVPQMGRMAPGTFCYLPDPQILSPRNGSSENNHGDENLLNVHNFIALSSGPSYV